MPPLALFWLGTGFMCVEKNPPPPLSRVEVSEISLRVHDPATGRPGVLLAWKYSEAEPVTHFNIYRRLNQDTVAQLIHTGVSGSLRQLYSPLPDSGRSQELQYGLKAMHIEKTGQRLETDSVAWAKLTVTSNLRIYSPTAGSLQKTRVVPFEISTGSDFGTLVKLELYQEEGRIWKKILTTCLPENSCNTPLFGGTLQRQDLVLPFLQGDTVSMMACAIGIESFEATRTALVQSIHCSAFRRMME